MFNGDKAVEKLEEYSKTLDELPKWNNDNISSVHIPLDSSNMAVGSKFIFKATKKDDKLDYCACGEQKVNGLCPLEGEEDKPSECECDVVGLRLGESQPCNKCKPDTISIPRSVAEIWIKDQEELMDIYNLRSGVRPLYEAIKQALKQKGEMK